MDIFLTKINKNGKIAWTEQFGTKMHDYVTSLKVDSDGNIYASGYTDFERRNLLLKFDKTGHLEWEKFWGEGQALSLEILSCSGIIAGGKGLGVEDLEAVKGSVVPTSYLAMFNEKGDLLFTKQFGIGGSSISSVTEDKNGNIISVGHSSYSFDDNVLTGEVDVFVTKWRRN